MADSVLSDLDIQSGIYRPMARSSPSRNASRGRYIDCDKIRFNGGRVEKMGGCVRYISAAFTGTVRGMLAWAASTFISYIAIGTATKTYVAVDSYNDITPARISGTEANNPFATTSGSAVVTVTHVAHGITVGTAVTWSGAATFNNVTMNGEFVVASIPTVDTFTVTALTTANAASSGGGAAVAYAYDINIGLSVSAIGLGYGVGVYGAGTYGSARSAGGVTQELRTWFFDTYGSTHVILIVQPSGGGIYYWDENSSADRAVVLTNAPTACRASFITNERMVVALGTDTPMTMEWSDRDDITDWVPTLANTANIRTIQEGSKLIAGTRFNDVNVFWSDTAFFLMQFLGSSDEIYSTPPVGHQCGLAGPTAFEVLPAMVVWFASSVDPYVYAGGLVQIAPNWEDIRQYIQSRLDLTKLDKMTTGQFPFTKEVIFWYVSVDSPDGEPDEYFKVKWETFEWDFGTTFNGVSRTAHVNFDKPQGAIVLAGADGYLYQHETGVDQVNGSNATIALSAFIETGPVMIYKGRDTDINGYVADFERIAGTVSLTVSTQEWPMSASNLDEQVFQLTADVAYQGMTMGGRYARWRWSVDDVGADFRLGIPQIDTIGAGGQTR